jgi:acyl dehydratase
VRIFRSIEEIEAAIGEDLGTTDWFTIDQELVTGFATLTRDYNWVHIDVERAKAGPFGGTIAHGYLTLSLLPYFSDQLMELAIPNPRLNYGLERVRFPAPVWVGQRVRGSGVLLSFPKISTGNQLIVRYTVEIEEAAKPACVAESILFVGAQP